MALKILGQSAPAGATETDVYTVPSSSTAVISTIFVSNRDATDDSFRISVSVDGAATSNEQFIYFDLEITGNDTFATTSGITLSGDDVVRFRSTNGNLSISLFGEEV